MSTKSYIIVEVITVTNIRLLNSLNRTHFVSSTHIIDLFNCFVVALSYSFILLTLNLHIL